MKITEDEWRQALIEAQIPPAVPKGWITMREFAELRQKQASRARAEMQLLISSGKAEMKLFLVKCAHLTRHVPHYRLKKK